MYVDLEKIKNEMELSVLGSGEGKDILVVVKDGYEYVKNCVDSIFGCTKDFRLLVWDNASSKRTADYLSSLKKDGVEVIRSETNQGFVVPNNRLLERSRSEWVILLNSDTEVLPMWDEVMIGVLKDNPQIKQVGYAGGLLDEKCEFSGRGFGREADYISGHCFCMARKDMMDFGLFDEENIHFAYCEDSDLSLRIRERGWEVYACHSEGLVRHYGGATTSKVIKDDKRLVLEASKNLAYMKRRWSSFLSLYRRR